MNGYEHFEAAETALQAAAATQGEELHYTPTEALLDAIAHALLAIASFLPTEPISVLEH